MSNPKRQHFLPQFYLEGFASQPVSSPPKFWFYDFLQGAWDVRTPTNTAVRKHYYTVENQEKEKDYQVEKYFADIEGKVKDLMVRKLNKGLKLKGSEHIATLAVFVYLMRSRVPYFRDKMEAFNVEIIEQMMSMMRQQAKKNPNYLKWLEEDMEKKTGEKMGLDTMDPDDFMNTDKFKIKMHQNFLVGLCLSHIDKAASIISRMNWSIMRTTEDAPFITCDNPYFEINPKSTSSWDRAGLLNKDIEISLPLSSTLCFFASWTKAPSWFSLASPRHVHQFNLRSMMGAREFIVASTKQFPAHENLERKTKALKEDSKSPRTAMTKP